MTGSGKTWAARRIIEQLAGKHWPIVIFDPHGDYTGLSEVPVFRDKVRRYHAQFPILEQESENVLAVVEALAGKELADTMHTLFDRFIDALEYATDGPERRKETAEWLADYLGKDTLRRFGVKPDLFLVADLAEAAWKAGLEGDGEAKEQLEQRTGQKELCLEKKEAGYIKGSIGRIRRAAFALKRMEDMNRQIAGTTLPLPSNRTELVRHDGISIVSLAGYSSDFQATIYRLVAEGLMDARVSGELKFPVLLVLEEGGTYERRYRLRLENTVYLPIIEKVLKRLPAPSLPPPPSNPLLSR